MAAGRISTQDRKDLERFTKFLIYKSLQIIVQSRLGEKIKTQSKSVSSGADWFNIAIKDSPDVQNEAKKLLVGQSFSVGQNVCLEISLNTADGDTMILEIWYLTMSEQTDSNSRTPHTAYYRMGIALKSVFSMSRITPAYKLSRQQNSDNYVVCYKMYIGEPKYYHLGDGYKSAKVASVPMATGTVNITVAYRTKLQISPQHAKCNKRFELKTDHFRKDNCVASKSPARPCNNDYYIDVIKTLQTREIDGYIAPYHESDIDQQNSNRDSPLTNGDATIPDGPVQPGGATINGDGHDQPDGATINCDAAETNHVTSQPITIHRQPQPYDSRPDDFSPQRTPEGTPSPHRKISAFAQHRTLKDVSMDLDEVPFASLLQRKDSITDRGQSSPVHATIKTDTTHTATIHNDVLTTDRLHNNTFHNDHIVQPNVGLKNDFETKNCAEDAEMSSTTKPCPNRMLTADEYGDFVMLELKTPFAGTDAGSELNQFYRECQTAPTLTMFDPDPEVDHDLDSITHQLQVFETSMKDFDTFVSSLQDSE